MKILERVKVHITLENENSGTADSFMINRLTVSAIEFGIKEACRLCISI